MPANSFDASCSDGSHPVGKVLLVDDEPELRRLLRRTLVRAGFEVVEAENGSAALDIARKSHFDLVITDVRMPCMGGLELLERLQLEDPSVPVVLISGSNELSNRQGAREVGAYDFLTKPIGLGHIQAVALAALAARRDPAAKQLDEDERASCERLRAAVTAAGGSRSSR